MMQIRDSADVVGVCDALLRPLVSSPALTCCWRPTQREEVRLMLEVSALRKEECAAVGRLKH